MANVNLQQLLEDSGAILKGHFQLASGRHSDVYFEKFRVLERPDVLSALCAEIAERFRSDEIDLVAGPTTGGIIIAFEVGRQLGKPTVYLEQEDGRRTLRRGARIPSGSRVLVVDDVFTTGTSVREVLEVLEGEAAEAVGVGVLIDRSQNAPDLGCPLFAAYRVEATSYPPDAIPSWLADIPVTRPGASKARR